MSLIRYQAPELSTWSPFDRLSTLRDEMNRLFDLSTPGFGGREDRLLGVWSPPLDVFQDKDNVYDLSWGPGTTYGELYKRAEWEWSTYNFEEANVAEHLAAFDRFEAEAKRLLSRGGPEGDPKQRLVLPAYDFVVKAAHMFNVLDARGAIGVTERARFIGRVRTLAKGVAEAYLAQREGMGFPLLKKDGREQVPAGNAP